jgi:hypothetical protein
MEQRMKRLTPQLIIMLSGALLIVAGLVLLDIQLSIPSQNPESGVFDADLSNLELITDHIGLAVLGVGAILEIVGFIGASLFSRGENSN